MYYYTTFISFIALLAADQVVGAAMKQAPDSVAGIQIASSPFYACNKPKNGDHQQGSSCKFYSGPSDKSPISSGRCQWRNEGLTCIV